MNFEFIEKIAEEKIREAERQGEFKDLPGAGKPLDLEDDSMIPEQLRMSYKILKNSGFVPPEVADKKEIKNIRDMLDKTTDEAERYKQIQKLNLLVTKMNMHRNRPVYLEENQIYYQKVLDKIRVK
ncbi:MAG: DnaJ family domain-containing protein [Desulfonatronovibrionaceae bacterium]